MLPTPAINYIPTLYRDDPKSTILADKMDEHIAEWKADVEQLERLIDPARCPSALLDELGYMLAAGLDNDDSDREKREKIAKAVQGHKLRGSWADDAKPKIDAIAGGDSSIFSEIDQAYWVLSAGVDLSAYKWSAFGFDSENSFDGIILTGIGDEVIFPGNIRIDCDNISLTAAQVEEMKLELEDVVPAYFRVLLGYTISGTFYVYGEELMDRWPWVAYYRLDGDVTDETENGNDGTPVGITYEDSDHGQAGVFDGGADYITLPSGVYGAVTLQSPWSFSILLNADTLEPADGFVKAIWFTNGAALLGIQWDNTNDRWSGIVRDSAGGNTTVVDGNTGTIGIGEVHLIIFTHDGAGTISLYEDGGLADTADITGLSDWTATGGWLGGDAAAASFHGRLDEPAVIDAVITAPEAARVDELYDLGMARSIGRME